ncbi:uncharacterized protein A4U43_C05F950 [Asparagus officinalis]|uniref:S-formylglutathione hydrolase n=1 Tax=Asparagus officinalis TaxID=4686 RepID=A0A5P1ENE6_ASPOF|nr:S-formylglutathione hydrolase-like [Asparagus officinalis]ONK67525.1 uncharacterized protein A4U43_C05F950 [Asparagus officinalis]
MEMKTVELKPAEVASSKMFNGYNKRYRHFSPTLGCFMHFSIFFPPPSPSQKTPVLYFLSGVQCTDETFLLQAGAQRTASALGIALVVPDTSPRGLKVKGEADSWDFGVGAGFYLNATTKKWKNWRMYDYVVKELPKILCENFEQIDTSQASLFGHSMGGHGALTIYLRNLDKYKSVSALAPMVNPTKSPIGQNMLSKYLGANKSDWGEYDATCLIAKYNKFSYPILIDQGEDDQFLHDQLLVSNFQEACKRVGAPLVLRMQPGYDHSYYFVSTFIADHIHHHAKMLKSA